MLTHLLEIMGDACAMNSAQIYGGIGVGKDRVAWPSFIMQLELRIAANSNTRWNPSNFHPDFIAKGFFDDGEAKYGGFRAGWGKTWRNSGALSREYGGEDREREELRGERGMSGEGKGRVEWRRKEVTCKITRIPLPISFIIFLFQAA